MSLPVTPLAGKVAIVTGSGRGLGLAYASELARQGEVVTGRARVARHLGERDGVVVGESRGAHDPTVGVTGGSTHSYPQVVFGASFPGPVSYSCPCSSPAPSPPTT